MRIIRKKKQDNFFFLYLFFILSKCNKISFKLKLECLYKILTFTNNEIQYNKLNIQLYESHQNIIIKFILVQNICIFYFTQQYYFANMK